MSVEAVADVSKLDQLPWGWEWARLIDLVAPEPNAMTDGPFGSKLKSSHYVDEGTRVIRLGNVGVGHFKDEDKSFISHEYAAKLSRHSVEEGDLVIAALAEPVGRACQVPRGILPAVVKADCVRFRPYSELEPQYIMHWLNSPKGKKNAEEHSHGVGRLRINMKNMRSLDVPLAPPGEQRRIVDEIEKQFTRLDAAVATLERAQANLERARASVLKAAVEGRLVPTEAELARTEGRHYEPASVLLTKVDQPPRPNRWKTRAKTARLGHASLAVGNPETDLPEGWSWAQLADIAEMQSGHTPSRRHPEWWDGDIPWIGIKDARAHHGGIIHDTLQHTNEEGLANSAARLLPEGTVCLSRTASVGYVVVMGRPMATSQDFVNWTPTVVLSADWLRVLLMADKYALLGFGKGSVHKTIYYPEVLAFHIGLPPLAEQRRITNEVDRQLSILDELSRTVGLNLSRSERLRQSILKRAFEGKLVPQDPSDEPAGKLLARIKAASTELRSR